MEPILRTVEKNDFFPSISSERGIVNNQNLYAYQSPWIYTRLTQHYVFLARLDILSPRVHTELYNTSDPPRLRSSDKHIIGTNMFCLL